MKNESEKKRKRLTQAELNPYPNSDTNQRYYTMDYFLRKKFGSKVCKIPLDGGFTCPNRDGTKGSGGCAFCSARGSGDFAARGSITDQITMGAEMMHRKWKDARIIPYFQAFTNTYAPLSVLKERFEEALSYPDVVGLCVATRADCITDQCAEYLHELSRRTFFMLELGLQTSNDATAERMNRGHSYVDFLRGYEKVKDLFVCIHLINGLPGEGYEDMIKTARDIASLNPAAVKIHLLHILKGTAVADDYLAGAFPAMELREYVETVCDQLEMLPTDTVIERLTGDGAEDSLIAPLWSKKKLVVRNEIDKELLRRDSYQGKRFFT
ncbi:MAG: TIGR01212 family radical SAM protein [Clostridia bacterium]|nr:TIGR01212 family radical SAM protein [Clostridia bacterium]